MKVRNDGPKKIPPKPAPIKRASDLKGCISASRCAKTTLNRGTPKPSTSLNGRLENISHPMDPMIEGILGENNFTTHEVASKLGDVNNLKTHALAKELLAIDHEVSNQFGRRVTKLQVLAIIYLMMQMEASSIYENRRSRQMDRALQLEQIALEKKSYQEMSNMLRTTGIGAAILGIFSGVVSIGGQFGGETIKNALGMVMSSFKEMKTDKAMEQISKMLSAMSEFGRMTGQAQQSYYTGHTSEAAHRTGLHGADSQNTTQEMHGRRDAFQTYAQMVKEECDRRARLEDALR
jgi:hypothetical protein